MQMQVHTRTGEATDGQTGSTWKGLVPRPEEAKKEVTMHMQQMHFGMCACLRARVRVRVYVRMYIDVYMRA